MNMAVATLLMGNTQQLPMGKSMVSNKSSSSFQQIFNNKLNAEEMTGSLEQLKELLNEDLQALFQSLEDGQAEELSGKLGQQLAEKINELSSGLKGDLSLLIKDLVSQITKEISVVDNEKQAIQVIGAFILNSINQNDNKMNQTLNSNSTIQGDKALTKIIQMLIPKVNGVVNQESNLQVNKMPPNVKVPENWSQKWNELISKLNQSNNEPSPINKVNRAEASLVSTKLVESIRQLLNSPNKMDQLNMNLSNVSLSKNQYTQNQPVNPVEQSQLNNQMTRQEQFIIHTSRPEQSTASTTNQQQIIEQLQKIIQSTRFSQLGGQKQLSIQLKPANLGDMMLKFTQIDGQMAVKISVTTQAAKEMLEGNLQQLRHLFSPNQVVVERQVDQTNTDYTQQFTDDEHSESDQTSQDHEQDQADTSDEQHEKSFSDYLFEEEV